VPQPICICIIGLHQQQACLRSEAACQLSKRSTFMCCFPAPPPPLPPPTPVRSHLERLSQLVSGGQLAVVLDPHRFVGLSAVPEAVELLQSGASSGKVVVQLSQDLPAAPGAPAKL